MSLTQDRSLGNVNDKGHVPCEKGVQYVSYVMTHERYTGRTKLREMYIIEYLGLSKYSAQTIEVGVNYLPRRDTLETGKVSTVR